MQFLVAIWKTTAGNQKGEMWKTEKHEQIDRHNLHVPSI
jgi:hypothetical protein